MLKKIHGRAPVLRGTPLALALSAAMAALAPQQTLIPAAARLDIPNANQWLCLHVEPACFGI